MRGRLKKTNVAACVSATTEHACAETHGVRNIMVLSILNQLNITVLYLPVKERPSEMASTSFIF